MDERQKCKRQTLVIESFDFNKYHETLQLNRERGGRDSQLMHLSN